MRPADQTRGSSRDTGPRPPWQELLRALREARGLTQEGWAARIGVSRKTVQRWERGERAPDPGAEPAMLAYCREAGLLRAFDRGPLAGMTLTEAGLRDLFSEARWRGAGRETAFASTAASARIDAAQPTNLPAQLTSFVGRERELAAVRRVQAGTRLLTLTGPGGCGKTRLALALADELLWAYPHGVWFVDLAPLTDPALMPQMLASALDIRTTGQPLNEALIQVLRARHLLLVVDNCEHLLPACAVVVETLLRACPHLEVVATSRESLGIGGETVWRVPPLAVPRVAPGGAEPGTQGPEAETADAVRLFVERARLQGPELMLTAGELETVAEICRQLDGMPLAIELAAARVNVLSVGQIAERLNDRFQLLTSGGRTVLPRHQTLQAAIDWSHDLLTAPERALLRMLSVFAGGCTLEMAEAVCGGSAFVLDLLTQLVDKSLVIAEEHRGVVRYRMLETVRQYAEQRLNESGEALATRARYGAWCLALVEAAESEMYGPHEVAWLMQLEQEHDNLRAALSWSLAQGRRERALQLAGSLTPFWELRGHLSEGRRWLSRALAMDGEAPAAGHAKALSGAGILAYMQGNFAEARALFEQSLVRYRECSDAYGIAAAQGNLGRTALRQGDSAAARAFLETSLALYLELGHKPGIANLQFTLGVIALRQADYAEARARFEASLALYRELGDRSGVAAVLGHLGMEAWARGDHKRAMTLLEDGLALYRGVGDRRGIARLLGNQSLVAQYQRDYDRAAALCYESLTLHREAGDSWAIGRYLPALAGAVFGQGQPERAARLFGAAVALRERLGVSLPPMVRPAHDRTIAALRETLGEPVFAAAWTAGRALSPESAIDT